MVVSHLRSALDACGACDGRLLVAASAGLDSTVLLAGLHELAPERGLELVVAHVDHQLRGGESQGDAVWVAQRAAALGLAHRVRQIDPQAARSGCSSRDRPTLEEAARDLRRRALLELAEEAGCRWIATGHHADDQAETVMLRILRGTGPEGLGAMAPVSADGRWLRPLLSLERETLRAWARARGLDWREDATNGDPRFARNRLRHDWLPGLAEAFNPRLLRTLCDLAEAQRRDAEWTAALVDEAARSRIERGPEGLRLALDGWEGLPEALARRLAKRALEEVGLGRSMTRTHLERVLAFLRRGREAGRDKVLELPLGASLRRLDDGFVLVGPGTASRGDGI